MSTLSRKSLFHLACSSMLLFVLFLQLAPISVRADVGVRPILPGGSNISTEEETPIHMAAETVEMTVRQATSADNDLIQLNPQAYGFQTMPVWYTAVAEVKADFTMHNPTGEGISMTVWFPLASALENVSWEINPDEIVPRIESFLVNVDGSPIDYSVSELPNPKGSNRPMLPWASFPVSFPAEADTAIQVSYLVPLVPAAKSRTLALYYVFQTGAGWAGPIGQAELIVNLPYPASTETMADMPAGSLDIPYMMAGGSTGLPSGAVLDGNQARWEWKTFEPTPLDDFSIWLLDPTDWVELVADRAAVQANPEGGQAWLQLASNYYSLSTVGYNFPSVFSSTYQPLGIEAYRKAASLLPDDPEPYAGLALLMLSPYMRTSDAPPDVLQAVQDELTICKELESVSPYPETVNVSCIFVDEALSIYSPNATATADAIAQSTASVQKTQSAAIVEAPTASPSPMNTPTTAPASTNTDLPQPTTTPMPVQSAVGGQSLLILMAAGLVAVIILGLIVSKRRRRKAG